MEECGMEAVETDLTLDEQGLNAVKSFLKGVVQGEQEHPPTPQPTPAVVWEPPIDNECP